MVIASVSNFASQSIAKHDRAANVLGTMSKMAKFYSSTAEFARKFFEGSQVAFVCGEIAKPLKQVADYVDVFNVLDPLNALLVPNDRGVPNYKTDWNTGWSAWGRYRVIAKVILIAGLILSPIAIGSSLGLFELGFLGANVGTVGKMPLIAAAKVGLILTSASMGLVEKCFSKSNDAKAALDAKIKFEQYQVLSRLHNDELVSPERAEIELVNLEYQLADLHEDIKKDVTEDIPLTKAERLDEGIGEKVNQMFVRFLAVPDDQRKDTLKIQTEYHQKLYQEKTLKVLKSDGAFIDDIVKVASLSLTLAAAFVYADLSNLTVVAAVSLTSAYLGWEKSDVDLRANQVSVDIYNSKKKNPVILSKANLLI